MRAWLSTLTDEKRADVHYWWHAPWNARDKQLLPDGDWSLWLILCGRGWGKNRTLSEGVRTLVESGEYGRLGLIARTAADVRDTMVEGESGILAAFPSPRRPHYEPSKRRITFENGAIATTYSADEPDRLRGPQHDAIAADEIASWRYIDTWDMAMLGLRLGKRPIAIALTTPRPIPLLKRLMADPRTHLTRGTTYENLNNLAPTFRAQIMSQYEGTRLGRQELEGEILDDMPGALWTRATLEAGRKTKTPPLIRKVVAVDPAISSGEESNETGIVVAGIGGDGKGYVLDDVTIKATPDGWAKQAISAYHRWEADRIVYEENQGGDMVAHTLRTVEANIPLKAVHASKGKQARAEPVAALYEQDKVHHVGMFGELEDQLCSWVPGDTSPDRLDALVWAFTDLMLGAQARVLFGA